MLTDSSVVQQDPHVITKIVEGTVYVLDSRTLTVHTLNSTAGFLWSECKEPKIIRDITSRLTEEFDVHSRRARRDVFEFISGYLKQKLLRLKKGGSVSSSSRKQ